ncbi:hypothetical protein [Streptomyces vilmorinianum]|uniref:hypothetical protein n=1 Tax=Streptomyces vilmorinianum TaxID=3051092 RepID=UPI0020C7B465|nr:hypothetical protein [Streptomyces vilmorinianum]
MREREVVGEVEADARNRLPLTRAGVRPGIRYRVEVDVDGVVVLTPVISIPKRELPVWTDPELRERLDDGLAAIETGERGKDRGDFTQYLDDEDDE